MPNIEIHGLPGGEAEDLRNIIFSLFEGKPYRHEMVVTVFPTKVKDAEGKDQPFLRLANSCQEHTREILEILAKLAMDIEHLKLEDFYPKGQLPPLKPFKQSEMD